jgi:hypothetical protein
LASLAPAHLIWEILSRLFYSQGPWSDTYEGLGRSHQSSRRVRHILESGLKLPHDFGLEIDDVNQAKTAQNFTEVSGRHGPVLIPTTVVQNEQNYENHY